MPLILMGHGSSGHKRADRQLMLGRRFASVSQIAAVAIDGPYHGDRVGETLDRRQYQAMLAAAGIDKVTDGMVDDWHATLDALSQLETIDADRVAYIGFSMGTRFGLPYVATACDRLRCAVLGKYGMRQASSTPAAVNMAPRFTQDAPTLPCQSSFTCSGMMSCSAATGSSRLFDMLGTSNKRLLAFPGHSTSTPEAVQAWCAFVTRHLTV